MPIFLFRPGDLATVFRGPLANAERRIRPVTLAPHNPSTLHEPWCSKSLQRKRAGPRSIGTVDAKRKSRSWAPHIPISDKTRLAVNISISGIFNTRLAFQPAILSFFLLLLYVYHQRTRVCSG